MDVPETRYTRSGDVSIAYQVAGEGPFDIVLVPSISHVELAWTRPDYQGQIPDRLASFARLIFFDRRGMGMSDRVVDESFETRMDDVRAVMDAAGSTRAALFGFLDGGAMSALFAATHPERVSALVLLSSFARVRWAANYPWGVPAEKWQAVKEQMMQFYFGSREEAVGVDRLWRGEGPSDDDLAADVDYLRIASASPRSLEAFFDTVGEIDIRQALGGIQAPTLLVHGTEAAPYPVEGSRYMAERIPRARLLELPGAPAIPWGADLEWALDETEAFLREAWEAGALEEPEPDRVLTVKCCLPDDGPGFFAGDADRVEAGEQAAEDDDQPRRRFGFRDQFDLAAVAVAFDGTAAADRECREAYESVDLWLARFAWLAPIAGKEDGDGGGELAAHLRFAASVGECPACLLVFVDNGQSEEDEPFAHRSHDGVVAIDGRCAAGDQAEFPRPGQRLAAVRSDVACPGSVVDLA